MRSAVVALTLSACVLTRGSDAYFDPNGVETIAATDNVTSIAYSGPSLYFTDGSRVLRVGADGAIDDPHEVARATTEVLSLSANGNGIVAWCDGTEEGAWFVREGGAAERLPDSTSCDRIVTGPAAVSYVASIASPPSSVLRRFDLGTRQYAPDVRLAKGDAVVTIASGEDGTIIAAPVSNGLARTCVDGDVGCEDGLCRISDTSPRLHFDLVVYGVGSAARPLTLADQAQLGAAPTSRQCCPFDPNVACATSDPRQKRDLAVGDAFAIAKGALFTLHAGTLTRIVHFDTLADDQPIVLTPITARHLAVSATHAFYVDGRKLQRVPLGSRAP